MEEGITDEEAVSLIDLEAPRLNKSGNKWQEMMGDGILLMENCFQPLSQEKTTIVVVFCFVFIFSGVGVCFFLVIRQKGYVVFPFYVGVTTGVVS